eukprot:scaffold8593_cov248-Pinguiococcus_pyrenoidosus.AAC.12
MPYAFVATENHFGLRARLPDDVVAARCANEEGAVDDLLEDFEGAHAGHYHISRPLVAPLQQPGLGRQGTANRYRYAAATRGLPEEVPMLPRPWKIAVSSP